MNNLLPDTNLKQSVRYTDVLGFPTYEFSAKGNSASIKELDIRLPDNTMITTHSMHPQAFSTTEPRALINLTNNSAGLLLNPYAVLALIKNGIELPNIDQAATRSSSSASNFIGNKPSNIELG